MISEGLGFVYVFGIGATILVMLLDEKFRYGGPCWIEWIGLVILASVWPLVCLMWLYAAFRGKR